MDPKWAANRLEQIRLLMDRSASYRRALAPTTLVTGSIGVIAAGLGWTWGVADLKQFVVYWFTTAGVTLLISLLMIRRQALQTQEPFWSLPTRRVAEAMFPPFLMGLLVGLLAYQIEAPDLLFSWTLPSVWMILYGCGLHSAGFFMPRGIKLFGIGFIITGSASLMGLLAPVPDRVLPSLHHAHLIMGASFGVLHLLYGTYLYLTETPLVESESRDLSPTG